jgi:hypothetical protein
VDRRPAGDSVHASVHVEVHSATRRAPRTARTLTRQNELLSLNVICPLRACDDPPLSGGTGSRPWLVAVGVCGCVCVAGGFTGRLLAWLLGCFSSLSGHPTGPGHGVSTALSLAVPRRACKARYSSGRLPVRAAARLAEAAGHARGALAPWWILLSWHPNTTRAMLPRRPGAWRLGGACGGVRWCATAWRSRWRSAGGTVAT